MVVLVGGGMVVVEADGVAATVVVVWCSNGSCGDGGSGVVEVDRRW